MKSITSIIILFITFSSFAQRKPELETQKKQKQEVKQTIMEFFNGFHSGDTTLMRKVIHKDLILQTISKNKEGEDVLHTDEVNKFLMSIATRPSSQRWDERLLLFTIQVDGTMANVWTPYEFWYNEQFSHCGVNSFQLMNENGVWKIIYLVDTRRKEDCQD
jgi:hypothetical protein